MKTTFPVLAAIVLLTACGNHARDDASLRTDVAGTLTTADVTLPDQAHVSDVMTTFQPNGSWSNRYTIHRAGNSRQQTTSGTWQIENGFLFETQTNIDGVADTTGQRGGSKILQLDSHEMVLSNSYSPRRIFSRKQ